MKSFFLGRMWIEISFEKIKLTFTVLCARHPLALSKTSIPHRLRGIFCTLTSSSVLAFFLSWLCEGCSVIWCRNWRRFVLFIFRHAKNARWMSEFLFFRKYITQSKLCSMISILLNGGYIARSHWWFCDRDPYLIVLISKKSWLLWGSMYTSKENILYK